MKKDNIIYWVTTTLIFLMEGVIPALTSQSEMAKEGIRHLGYPDYFGVALAMFKVAGAIVLIVPQFPRRLKELAYAGFFFDFIFATISHGMVDGWANGMTFLPLVVLGVLAVSWKYYQKRAA